MVNVGCKFQMDDLTPETWDGLIALAMERQYVDRVLDKRRSRTGAENAALAKARRQGGVPAPGQTIFKPTKPFRGPTR